MPSSPESKQPVKSTERVRLCRQRKKEAAEKEAAEKEAADKIERRRAQKRTSYHKMKHIRKAKKAVAKAANGEGFASPEAKLVAKMVESGAKERQLEAEERKTRANEREKNMDIALKLYKDSLASNNTIPTPRKKKAKCTAKSTGSARRPMGTIDAVRSNDSDSEDVEDEDSYSEPFPGLGENVGGPKGTIKQKSRLVKGLFGNSTTTSDDESEDENFDPKNLYDEESSGDESSEEDDAKDEDYVEDE